MNEENQTLSAALAAVVSSAELKETYFTTPLALSFIERPRKWHKGKGKDKRTKMARVLERILRGAKARRTRVTNGAKHLLRIQRSRASFLCGARRRAATFALHSTRRDVQIQNANAYTCAAQRAATRIIRLVSTSKRQGRRRNDYRQSRFIVFPPLRLQNTCLISHNCTVQRVCVCSKSSQGLIAKVMWALFFRIWDRWILYFSLTCNVHRSMI